MGTQSLGKFILLLSTLFSNCYFQDDGFLDINISNNQAAAITSYTFILFQDISITIPSNSIINIEFPIEYQDVVEDGTHACTPSGWADNPTLVCAMTGLTLSISGGFPSQI